MTFDTCVEKCMEYNKALELCKGYVLPRRVTVMKCKDECRRARRTWRIKGRDVKANAIGSNASHR